MGKPVVTKVEIEVGKTILKMSLEEAKDLYSTLTELFGKEEVVRFVPWYRDYWHRYPWTYTTSGTYSALSALGGVSNSAENLNVQARGKIVGASFCASAA